MRGNELFRTQWPSSAPWHGLAVMWRRPLVLWRWRGDLRGGQLVLLRRPRRLRRRRWDMPFGSAGLVGEQDAPEGVFEDHGERGVLDSN